MAFSYYEIFFVSLWNNINQKLLNGKGGEYLDILLEQIHRDLDYLYSQGKHVKKIKMNPKVYERMTNKLTGVEINNEAVIVFGIPIEADENIEKFAFILDEAT